ncbi:hypothetical protein G4D82_03235 [Flavobacterium sp. CYK-4]|uniref:hypothetical protein n=1 Tax=Flavobacterium lotistagni TaxID=2709660 RepID=UPI001409E509|nr:hypothetical protein [Flavobacterium lotistagni]NHM06222.1 hypothetical protein [Flavobacterium lotistagni]
MKKTLLSLLILTASLAFGQDFFSYKISKPYCVFNFMETATGGNGTSAYFRKFIEEKTQNNPKFKNLCKEYIKINLSYHFKRYEFPDERRPNRSTFDLISIQAVNSANLNEFKAATVGILPIVEYQKLFDLLFEAEKIYDEIIWKDYEKKIINQKNNLIQFKKSNVEIFNRFNAFYHSTWTNEIPFQIALYPIPGKNGSTTAMPHGNSLCIGVLTDETDYVGRNGVIVHEMCHVLYDEQSKEFQKELVSYFAANQSEYSKFASTYFDEALATALGNGWAYQNITGKMDSEQWYNDPYIEGFARALYPLVESYLNENKPIDKNFIDQAISLFGLKFPNANADYSILLNKLYLYYDNENESEITVPLRKYFRLSHLNSSSPILHPYSIDHLKESAGNQLIIINQNQQNTLNQLKEIYPELSAVHYENEPLLLSFFDPKGNAVLLLVVKNNIEFEALIELMNTKKYFDKTKLKQN